MERPLGVRPPEPLGLAPSFGFGDRLGLATPGHLAAWKLSGHGIQPIFAQQSIREMQRTARSPEMVIGDVQAVLEKERFPDRWSADADHLKTTSDVKQTVAAGFVFFTIDPSDYVDPLADSYGESDLDSKLNDAHHELNWVKQYQGRNVTLADGLMIEFDRLTVQRALIKYGPAVAHTIAMSREIESAMKALGKNFEIELSVDETPQPTTPAEHFIIAEQCLHAGIKLVSLAPRYVGDFEKGIDFKGDRTAFTHSLQEHATIAQHLGPYKLSLHSGSDKLSIYEDFARITQGLFHVKTAGTSYLEALRVTARHDVRLFREMVQFSRTRFDTDRATYHVSAQLAAAPDPDSVSDRDLETAYLNRNDGRQILHVSFGSVLNHPELGPALHEHLRTHPETHCEILSEHFQKHLEPLAAGC